MIKSTVRDRISQYLNCKGISDYRFEKDLGLSKGYWSKAKNPSSDILSSISGLYTDLSAEWLLTGEGEMIKPSVPHAGRSDIHTSYTGTFTKPIVTDIRNVNGNTAIGHGSIAGSGNTITDGCSDSSPRKKTGKSDEASLHDLEKSLFKTQMKLEFLEEENGRLKALLNQAIADKDKAVSDKDKAMAMLERVLGK